MVKLEIRKTIVINLSEVAKALRRPPTYLTKYFGYQLGIQTQIKQGRYILNGIHSASALQKLLDVFIKRFVLCERCDNPETVLIVAQGIGLRCKACGHLFKVDTNHKLATYIMKNPPD